MQVGDACFLRKPLHREGQFLIPRGARGTLVRQDGPEASVEFQDFGEVVIPDIAWLEPHPGTFSRGFAALSNEPRSVYRSGMICTDMRFPRPDQKQHGRLYSNQQLLCGSGAGASFFDGINAEMISQSFHSRYPSHTNILDKVGFIVCEYIWPWEPGSRVAFHLRVVRSFLAQLSNIPKVVLLRSRDVEPMRNELDKIARVVLLDSVDFQNHYQPLRMNWNADRIDPINGDVTAIYIKPIVRPAQHIVHTPLFIPREVLLQMFNKKHTLFVAAGSP